MAKNQVKFYVDDDEKRRLEVLAKLRHLSVPTYVKLIALGVKVQQVKEVFIESEKLFYSQPEEKLIMCDNVITLSDEDKVMLEDIVKRNTSEGYIRYDAEFNTQLANMARRLLGKENVDQKR